MKPEYEDLIKEAYSAFNARDIDSVLAKMNADVHWPNGWEGGYVSGHNEVRDYWTRQWKEVNPIVNPVSFNKKPTGEIEVKVHQVVKDMEDNLLFDGHLKHIFAFEDGKIKSMEIEK